ncbi:MAG: DUF4159 domain-containing protein [Candidatus Latescibacterota bacterium]|jgi:hypothetical protein
MKKHLVPLMFLVMAGYSAAGAQPPGYSSSNDAAQRINITGTIGIAQVWGEELKPPSNTPRAIINLKDALLRWTDITATVENHVLLGKSDIAIFPVLFISTDKAFQLSETEKTNLKEYLKNGGFLVVDNAGAAQDNGPSGASLIQMIKDIAGSSRLEPISNSNPIFHTPFELGGPPAGSVNEMQRVGTWPDGQPSLIIPTESKTLQGVTIDGRLAVVYSNMGYSVKWNADTGNDPQLKMGVNLILHALNQKK